MAREVVIEKGVPIPPKHVGAPIKYPRKHMEVGDSVFFPKANRKSVASTYSRRGRESGHKYETRPEGNGVRVWRME